MCKISYPACCKRLVLAARDLVIPILLLYAAEILGMMAGSLVYSFLPRQGLSSYLYSLLSTAVYIALLCALTAFYEKKVLHLPPAKPAALSPHQRRRLGLFIAAELASILLTVFLIVWLCPGHWAVVPAEQWGILLFRAVIDFGIGAGIAEEVLFRGTMRKAFQKNFGISGAKPLYHRHLCDAVPAV